MRRFHIHVHVDDVAASVAFYSKLFSAEPSRVEADYAKWMLDDPRVNFAVSTRGTKVGVDHLGFQVDDAAELAELSERASAADMTLLDQGGTTCCYARSNKHWIVDPQGIAWEHFHTLDSAAVYGESRKETPTASASAGCAPSGKPVGVTVKAASSACC